MSTDGAQGKRYFTDEQKRLFANVNATLAAIYAHAYRAIKAKNPHIDQDSALAFFSPLTCSDGVAVFRDGEQVDPAQMMEELRKGRDHLPVEQQVLVPRGRGFSDDAEATLAQVNHLTGLIGEGMYVHKYREAALPQSPAEDKVRMRHNQMESKKEFDQSFRAAAIALRSEKPLMIVAHAIKSVIDMPDLTRFADADTEEKREALAQTLILDAANTHGKST